MIDLGIVKQPNQAIQLSMFTRDAQVKRVVFHSDFDGACAAAIMMDVVGSEATLQPITYASSGKWLSKNMADAAVLDFLFHPQAVWWFDHHATSFQIEEMRTLYRPDSQHRWDPSYDSCPALMLDVLAESRDVSDLRHTYAEWLKWADIIDSAKYSSPTQAVLGLDPCVLINHALAQSPAFDLRIRLVREIRRGTEPNAVANMQPFLNMWTAFRRKQDEALEQVQSRLKRAGDVGFCNISDLSIPFIRYGVYLFMPDVKYSVTAYASTRGMSSSAISLSANPWLVSAGSPVNLGLLARTFGGGGRDTVGSIPCPDPRTCERILEEVIATLQTMGNSEDMEHIK